MKWLDVLAIVVPLVFAAIAALRGFRRAVFVLLAGVVLGVLMGSLWGDAFGQTLANRFGATTVRTQGTIRLCSLLLIVVVIGYGGGLFFAPRKDLRLWQRLLGALVGLFNGLLLETFAFQYIQEYYLDGKPNTLIQTSPVARGLTEWLPWVSVVLVLAASLAVVSVALTRVVRFARRSVQEPTEAPTA
jgi:uncharacterized membrane protein required for colicin V production